MNPILILLAFLAGSVVTYAITRLYRNREQMQAELDDLKAQVRGKQVPYTVRNGLLDIMANDNYTEMDLDLMIKHYRSLGNLIETQFEYQRRRKELSEQLYQGKYEG